MGHWYSKDGSPQHFITGANGKQRDSTLRDARKHGWYPSVTGILDTIAKPGLVNWMINQSVLAALTIPRIDDEPDDALIARIRKDGAEEGKRAAERGIEIHDDIEKLYLEESDASFVDGDLYLLKHSEIAVEAWKAISKYCGTNDFTPEKTVVGDGYGGKVDLHNDDFVIDYKTKIITDEQWEKYQIYLSSMGKKKPPKLAYDEHCMQLAAYKEALPMVKTSIGSLPGLTNMRRLVNVFVDRNIAGRVIIHEWTGEEAILAWQKFDLLVKYWQLTKNYYPDNEES